MCVCVCVGNGCDCLCAGKRTQTDCSGGGVSKHSVLALMCICRFFVHIVSSRNDWSVVMYGNVVHDLTPFQLWSMWAARNTYSVSDMPISTLRNWHVKNRSSHQSVAHHQTLSAGCSNNQIVWRLKYWKIFDFYFIASLVLHAFVFFFTLFGSGSNPIKFYDAAPFSFVCVCACIASRNWTEPMQSIMNTIKSNSGY